MPIGVYQHYPYQGLQKGYVPSEEHRGKIGEAHKGKKQSPETIEKRRLKLIGRIAWNKGVLEGEGNAWKGDNVGYSGLHEWVRKHLGKPTECVYCGKDEGKLNWANVSHEYKRELEDFMSLCISCHRKYDYEFERSFV